MGFKFIAASSNACAAAAAVVTVLYVAIALATAIKAVVTPPEFSVSQSKMSAIAFTPFSTVNGYP